MATGIDSLVLVTILGMAAVTYAARVGGFWLIGRVPVSPRVDAWLRLIPGAVLVAIVAPAATAAGLPGILAALGVLLVAQRTGNVVLAMVAGVGLVVALRWLL